MKEAGCLIFEINRQQKKAIVFNENLEIISEESSPLDEIADEDGFRTFDLHALVRWLENTFQFWSKSETTVIKAVNFITFSASLVHIDSNGNVITPVYNFLKRFPRELESEFIEKYGPIDELTERTSSPFQGMFNAGLQLYWLKKHKVAYFKPIRYSLHLPHYLSYLFTKEACTDYTSIGLHTMLWDFQQNDYADWVKQEHLKSIQVPVKDSTTVFQAKDTPHIQVGIGMQYVAATLKALQESVKEPFLLVSSKMWTMNANPYTKERLTSTQIKHDCFYYLDTEGKKVMASRVHAGNEHQRQTKHLAEYFHKSLDYHKTISYDMKMVWDLRKRFLQATPSTADIHLLNDCPFVERNLNQFRNYEEAYHQFMLDLVAQEVAAIKQIQGYASPRILIVEGEFSDNELFMRMLAEAFFDKHVYASEYKNLSALGAALVISDNWNKNNMKNFSIKLKRYE